MRALACRLSTIQCSKRTERLCHLETLYSLHAARLRLLRADSPDLGLLAKHTFLAAAHESLSGVALICCLSEQHAGCVACRSAAGSFTSAPC